MSEFSDTLVEEAWARSGCLCECQCTTHGHQSRCGKTLLKAYRSDRFSFFAWEAHSKSGRHLDSLSDCEILCREPCYLEALSTEHKTDV